MICQNWPAGTASSQMGRVGWADLKTGLTTLHLLLRVDHAHLSRMTRAPIHLPSFPDFSASYASHAAFISSSVNFSDSISCSRESCSW